MEVSPATTIPPCKVYKYKTLLFTSNANCKFFYIPKHLYKKALADIKKKKEEGKIKEYLIIPCKNYDGAYSLINY